MSELLPSHAGLAVFAGAVFVLNATPGVDFLLTVTRTLQGGWRAGVAAVLGINAGCVLHALAAAFGLAALLALHPSAFAALQWAGAGFLAWLGLGMWRQAWASGGMTPAVSADEAASDPAEGASASARSGRRPAWLDFRTGLFTNVLNPKVALFFLAFLPQFVPADSPDRAVSFLLLGAWFVGQSLLFSLALVAVAAPLGRLGGSPSLRRGLNALGGSLFIGLALRLLGGRPVAG